MRRVLAWAATWLWLAATLAGCATVSGSRLYVSGTAALDRGESASAIADLQQAARLLPESSEVQNHLGIAYEAAGRDGDAEAAYQRAVALDCGNEAAVHNLREVSARRLAGPTAAAGVP